MIAVLIRIFGDRGGSRKKLQHTFEILNFLTCMTYKVLENCCQWENFLEDIISLYKYWLLDETYLIIKYVVQYELVWMIPCMPSNFKKATKVHFLCLLPYWCLGWSKSNSASWNDPWYRKSKMKFSSLKPWRSPESFLSTSCHPCLPLQKCWNQMNFLPKTYMNYNGCDRLNIQDFCSVNMNQLFRTTTQGEWPFSTHKRRLLSYMGTVFFERGGL